MYSCTMERQQQLEEILPLAQKYSEAVSEFIPRLNEIEQIVEECQVIPCEKHGLSREHTLIKVGPLSVWTHSN